MRDVDPELVLKNDKKNDIKMTKSVLKNDKKNDIKNDKKCP